MHHKEGRALGKLRVKNYAEQNKVEKFSKHSNLTKHCKMNSTLTFINPQTAWAREYIF